MIITSAVDFEFLEQYIRKCMGCETNFCSLMKSRPYKLFRLRVLAYLEGSDVQEAKVYFFLCNFALHMYAAGPRALHVDVEWFDPMSL